MDHSDDNWLYMFRPTFRMEFPGFIPEEQNNKDMELQGKPQVSMITNLKKYRFTVTDQLETPDKIRLFWFIHNCENSVNIEIDG